MGKLRVWSSNKRALSPIFATVLLATIVIIFGSVAYYYATNLTTTTTNNYVSTVANSQQSIAERIAFENVVYTRSSPATLTVYLLNCGSSNNVKVNSIFLYDASHNIAGGSPYSYNDVPQSISPLTFIDGGTIPSNSLNVGQEGTFTVALDAGASLPNQVYTIHLITQSGSYFDYEFTP